MRTLMRNIVVGLLACVPLIIAQFGQNTGYTAEQIEAIRNYFRVETIDGRQVILDQDGDEVTDLQSYRFPTMKERFEHRVSEEFFENIIQDFFLQFPFCFNGLKKITETLGANTTAKIEFVLGEICEELYFGLFNPLIDPLKQAVLGRGPDYQSPVYVRRQLITLPSIVDFWNFIRRLAGRRVRTDAMSPLRID